MTVCAGFMTYAMGGQGASTVSQEAKPDNTGSGLHTDAGFPATQRCTVNCLCDGDTCGSLTFCDDDGVGTKLVGIGRPFRWDACGEQPS